MKSSPENPLSPRKLPYPTSCDSRQLLISSDSRIVSHRISAHLTQSRMILKEHPYAILLVVSCGLGHKYITALQSFFNDHIYNNFLTVLFVTTPSHQACPFTIL